MNDDWLTPAELTDALHPGLSGKARDAKIRLWQIRAKDGGWKSRRNLAGAPLARREGRGGGWKYHVTVLPQEAQLRLAAIRAKAAASDVPAPEKGTAEVWAWFDRQTAKKKDTARQRLRVLDQVENLVRGGLQKNSAVAAMADAHGIGARTIWGWYDMVAGADRADWLPHLAPRNQGRTATADMSAEAWAAFKADYLRQEQPPAEAVYDRIKDVAAERGWTVPSVKTFLRRVDREIPHACQVLMRKGPEAARLLYPAQERDRSHFHALQAVNADGHRVDVWKRWPDGDVSRPFVTVVQDLHSNKWLGWRVDKNPTATGVRLAFYDVFRKYGIPDLAWLDNGREFAAKIITGGQPTRYRFKVTPDELNGVLTELGVQVHWTTPRSGQSKPIERSFRDFCNHIAKHPALAGAYAGNSPMNKPDYRVKPVDLDNFLAVLEDGIKRHNARPGRRTGVCAGTLSFDQAFKESYERAPIRRATEAQLRMAMLSAERVTARQPNGSLHVEGNRYWDEFLTQHIGEKMTVRFDPEALHEPLHVYRTDGVYLGAAQCWEAVGFDSVDAARDHNRKRREWLKNNRRNAQLEQEMTIDQWAAMQPGMDEPEPPAARMVRLVTGNLAAARAMPAADPDHEDFDFEGFSRGLTLIAGDLE